MASLVVFVLAALLAATATLLARAWQWWRNNDTDPAADPPANPRSDQPTERRRHPCGCDPGHLTG